jgi:hypothetical protein
VPASAWSAWKARAFVADPYTFRRLRTMPGSASRRWKSGSA